MCEMECIVWKDVECDYMALFYAECNCVALCGVGLCCLVWSGIVLYCERRNGVILLHFLEWNCMKSGVELCSTEWR